MPKVLLIQMIVVKQEQYSESNIDEYISSMYNSTNDLTYMGYIVVNKLQFPDIEIALQEEDIIYADDVISIIKINS